MKKFVVCMTLILLLSTPSIFNGKMAETENENEVFYISSEKIERIEGNIENATFKILQPRCSAPAIIEKGGIFTIVFEKCSFTQIFAKISTAYEPVVDEIYLEIEEFYEDEEIYLSARVPENTPVELYNLTVIVENNGYFAKTEPRAVSVVDKIDGNFTFIHLTDFHIGDIRGFKENIRETIGWKAAKKCIEEINLIHPDFVIITGDLVFGQLYPFEYLIEYRSLYRILQQFDVPTYLCPGNHDGYVQCGEDGFEFWQEYFGPLYYSFDYGSTHWIMANSYDWSKPSRFGISYIVFNWGGYIGREQLKWIENDLEKNEEKIKFIALHHNPLWETKNDSLLKNEYEGRKELLSMIERYGVKAVFDGHVHYDNVTIKNGTLYITTTTASSSLSKEDAYWGYRLIEARNNSIFSYNYREPEYSIPSYMLNYTFENEYRMRVENNLDMNISAYIVFTVPSGEYEIKNGEIFMEREGNGIKQIYVISEIERKTEKEIYLLLL
ncbi:MAG TPA: metallophosphoesterase [Thermoplasmata archaeon]|nr:metallophosphoesterase [Thermoplasmata archaeon]